jgi:regulator of sigma E protease
LAAVLNFVFSIAVFLCVLGVLILIHELGHYSAGRMLGFSIEAFSIGFGPKLYERKGKHNLWQIRWILFGGFVKFKGELGEELALTHPVESGLSAEPNSSDLQADAAAGYFYNKKRWQRFIVMVMGVVFNVIFAYLVFSIISFYGIEESILKDKPPVVGAVAPGSPAEKSGIRKGDRILCLDGRKVKNWEEAKEEIASLMQKDYKIELERVGEKITTTVSPKMLEFLKQPLGDIGVIPAFQPIIGAVANPSPAQTAGLKADDMILEVQGQKMNFWDELSLMIRNSNGSPVALKIKRGGKEEILYVTPQYVEAEKRFMVGVVVKDSEFVRYPFPRNFLKAGDMVFQQASLAERTIKKLFQRKIPLKALSAPPSIAYITGKVARTGFYNLFFLLGVISFQLGFFNLFPIPGLDGGQILILGVEGTIRRDLPDVVKDWILRIGFGFLILFFVVILCLDLFKYV